MADPLFSPSWYRVARLRPRLRGHTRIYRHVYRGEVWFVLQDHAKNRYYRFTPNVYQVLGKMDGRATIQDVAGEVPSLLQASEGDFLRERGGQGEVAIWATKVSVPHNFRIYAKTIEVEKVPIYHMVSPVTQKLL